VFAVLVHAIQPLKALLADVLRVVAVGQEFKLPTTGIAIMRHVIDAHPSEETGRVKASVPERPEDLGDLVESLRRVQEDEQSAEYYEQLHLMNQ
jgi:hypothetical protein